MKRTIVIAMLLISLAGLPAAAQQQRYSLHLNGWGGFGFDWNNTGSLGGLDSSYRNLGWDFGVDANGCLYDPRLADYDVSLAYDRAALSLTQGNSSLNGLNVNANLSFLPDRSFPFSVYFTRTDSGYQSELLPPYTTIQTIFGFRGMLKKLPVGQISYNFAEGNSRNEIRDGPTLEDRFRTFDVSLTRKLAGWELRAGDDYNWSSNNIAGFTQSNNNILADASRTFRERIRVDVNTMFTTFSYTDDAGSRANNQVLSLNANATWKHTEKLDSYYSFSLTRDAINELGLLSNLNNVSNPLPFNPVATDSTAENLAAGATYRVRPSLTLNAAFGISHNSPPNTANLTPAAVESFTTSTMNVGGGLNYRRKLWKLLYAGSGSVALQRFTTLGNTDFGSGLGFSVDNGISGGDVRKLRFTVGYRYSRRSNPVFFNASRTTDNHVSLQLASSRFKLAHLEGSVEYGKTELQLFDSKLNLGQTNFMLMASRPKLSLFFARTSSNSDSFFFLTGSPLDKQGPSQSASQSTQDLLPNPFFNPLVITELRSTRAGVMWRPRPDLQVEGRYAKYDDLFLLPSNSDYKFTQIEALVTYKWGRFTLYGGYGRALSSGGVGTLFDQHVNRIFFRVRFPFHIM